MWHGLLNGSSAARASKGLHPAPLGFSAPKPPGAANGDARPQSRGPSAARSPSNVCARLALNPGLSPQARDRPRPRPPLPAAAPRLSGIDGSAPPPRAPPAPAGGARGKKGRADGPDLPPSLPPSRQVMKGLLSRLRGQETIWPNETLISRAEGRRSRRRKAGKRLLLFWLGCGCWARTWPFACDAFPSSNGAEARDASGGAR